MNVIKWASKNLKKMDIWDIGAIKWASLLIGAIIGAYIATFVKRNLVILIIIAVLLMIRPIYRWFK